MSATAKVFMTGRSQAVRLPKAFRVAATELRISRDGDKIVLEPVRTPFDVDKWRAELDALGARDFLPEGRPEQPPMPPDDDLLDF